MLTIRYSVQRLGFRVINPRLGFCFYTDLSGNIPTPGSLLKKRPACFVTLVLIRASLTRRICPSQTRCVGTITLQSMSYVSYLHGPRAKFGAALNAMGRLAAS